MKFNRLKANSTCINFLHSQMSTSVSKAHTTVNRFVKTWKDHSGVAVIQGINWVMMEGHATVMNCKACMSCYSRIN